MINATARRPFGLLADQQLLDQTRRLVANKRTLEVHILDHLAEIDRRGLALRRGFSSLFDYAVRELGFSDAAAQRRILTMRLARRHEWVRAELQSGDLNLTSAAQLETAFAAAERQWRQQSRREGERQRDHDGQSPGGRVPEVCGVEAVARASDVAPSAAMSGPAPEPVAPSASADAAEEPGTAECTSAAVPAADGMLCPVAADSGSPARARAHAAAESAPSPVMNCEAGADECAAPALPASAAEHGRGDSPAAAESASAAVSATGVDTSDGRDGAKCVQTAVTSGAAAHHRDDAPTVAESVPAAMPATGAITSDERDAPKRARLAVPPGATVYPRDGAPTPTDAVPGAMPATGAFTSGEPGVTMCPLTSPSVGNGHDQVAALPVAPPAESASRGVSASDAVATDEPVAVDCAAAAPLLDPRRQRELIRQAAGLSTRQVAGLIAAAAGPGTAQPRDTLRTVGNGRYTLKVSIDEECERGLRQLKGLLSHLDPRMSWGDLVARLVREAVERHDPRCGGRGRRRRVDSVNETPRSKQEEVHTPGRTAESGVDGPTPAPKCTGVNPARSEPATSAPAGASGRPPALRPPSASLAGDAPAAATDTPAPESSYGSTTGERPVKVTAQSATAAAAAPKNEIGTRRQHRNPTLVPRTATPAAHSGPRTSIDGRPPSADTATNAPGHAARPRRRTARRRAIPASVRRLVWERDQGCCYYRDPVTGRRCNSSHLLQIDHVLPVARGGRADPANLRLACFAHHRLRHRVRAGTTTEAGDPRVPALLAGDNLFTAPGTS